METDELRVAGWSHPAILKLMALREKATEDRAREFRLEARRLEFARWLYQQKRISG